MLNEPVFGFDELQRRLGGQPPTLPLADYGAAAPVPADAEIWLTAWDDAAFLAIVGGTAEGGAENIKDLIPLSIGHDEADDSAVLLEPGDTTLGVPVTVWLEDAIAAPAIVLRGVVGKASSAVATPAQIRGAVAHGARRKGPPALNGAGRRALARKDLAQVAQHVAAAHHLAEGSGALPNILKDAQMSVTEFAATLDIPTARALSIFRGHTAVDHMQAAALSERLGMSADELLAANPAPDPSMSSFLSERAQRDLVDEVKQVLGGSDSSALRQLVSGLALAARKEGEGPDWAARARLFVSSLHSDDR